MIPKEPMMLLSYVNMQLRDFYPSLEELCRAQNLNQAELEEKLGGLDYHYNASVNQFK